MRAKYKILVLVNLNEFTDGIIISAIELAKKINAEISLFHVKKATDIVKRENQLSAVRAINSDYNVTDKKIKLLVNEISKAHQIPIKYAFAIGNVKHELDQLLENSQPDIIVLGKPVSKTFSFMGDNMVKYVLKNHAGGVLVVDPKNRIRPKEDVVVATLNSSSTNPRLPYLEDLFKTIHTPLKSFKIVNKGIKPQDLNAKNTGKTVEYIFEKGDNSIRNLSKYLSLNNINVLCLDLGANETESDYAIINMDRVLEHLNVSILVS